MKPYHRMTQVAPKTRASMSVVRTASIMPHRVRAASSASASPGAWLKQSDIASHSFINCLPRTVQIQTQPASPGKLRRANVGSHGLAFSALCAVAMDHRRQKLHEQECRGRMQGGKTEFEALGSSPHRHDYVERYDRLRASMCCHHSHVNHGLASASSTHTLHQPQGSGASHHPRAQ
jgi:hypothetical protein